MAHWDAVSGSIARLRPWAIADHVIHTGFTVSWREKQEGQLSAKSSLCSPGAEGLAAAPHTSEFRSMFPFMSVAKFHINALLLLLRTCC